MNNLEVIDTLPEGWILCIDAARLVGVTSSQFTRYLRKQNSGLTAKKVLASRSVTKGAWDGLTQTWIVEKDSVIKFQRSHRPKYYHKIPKESLREVGGTTSVSEAREEVYQRLLAEHEEDQKRTLEIRRRILDFFLNGDEYAMAPDLMEKGFGSLFEVARALSFLKKAGLVAHRQFKGETVWAATLFARRAATFE